MYFLDSNICLYFLRDQYPALSKKLLTVSPGSIKIPSIAEAEILTGVEKGARSITREIWEEFFAAFEIVSFDDDAARRYALIRSYLEKQDAIIGPNDLITAATVLANNGILVTHNVQEFERVPGITIEDWTG
ncbi:nucleic acid-binding protein [Spirochaetia bacterium]|nr:nucleic acid-binding protein [Spirochaetia bacterium]